MLEKICLLYLYSTDSLQRAHVQLIFSILQQHDILTGERVSRRIEEREDGERHAESGIPPSDHYERHVKRGRETEALTWASPHRERLRGGREGSRDKGSRGIDRNGGCKEREGGLRRGGRERIVRDGENGCKENDKREKGSECVGIMRWGRWRGGGGGGGEECSSDPPIDRVQLDWLHRPHLLSALLCPPITPLSSPSPLPPSRSQGPK